MSHDEPRRQAPAGLDPEAEQDVDFGRYWRLLVARWWLVAAGLLLGAVVGYAVGISGSRSFRSAATVYVGQPYSTGGSSLQTLQSNPSAVEAIISSPDVIRKVAAACKGKPIDFRNAITTEEVPGAILRAGQSPVVQIVVQSRKAKESACVSNRLAREVVDRINGFAAGKIRNYRRRIAADQQSINIIKTGIASAQVTTTDKLLFQLQLRNFQEDQIAAGQLLLQATQVEAPRILTPAIAERASTLSRRNALVAGALIGLVLGIVLAFTWDRIGPRLTRRNSQ